MTEGSLPKIALVCICNQVGRDYSVPVPPGYALIALSHLGVELVQPARPAASRSTVAFGIDPDTPSDLPFIVAVVSADTLDCWFGLSRVAVDTFVRTACVDVPRVLASRPPGAAVH
jgi:hypothetical protein